MAKCIPTNEIGETADQADAEQGQVLLEERNKKRVRYWWEEGYVPGNEQDSDDEGSKAGSESGSDTKATEGEKPPDTNTMPSLEPDEDSDYEEVVPGDARGGRRMRWGGLHGRLCLADGMLAVEDGEADEVLDLDGGPAMKALPPLQDYLDELLLPGADIEEEEQAEAEAARMLALENSGSATAAETTAIVLYQTPETRIRPWSFCQISDHLSAAEVDQSQVRQMYAIEDSKPNPRLYSEEMQVLSQIAIGNYLLHQEYVHEVVQKAKEDEKIRRRQVKEGATEKLPGTRQPLAVSQAWQDHLAGKTAAEPETGDKGSGSGKQDGDAERAGDAVASAPPAKPRRQRKTLLPGSLSASSSSGAASSGSGGSVASSSTQLPMGGGMRKEPPIRMRRPDPQASSLQPFGSFDSFDFEPEFRIPAMPLPKRMYRPSNPGG